MRVSLAICLVGASRPLVYSPARRIVTELSITALAYSRNHLGEIGLMSASLTVRPLAADILAECGYSRPKQPTQTAASTAATAATPAKSFKLPELKTKSAEETTFRAYFLAMAVINNHKMMLSALAEKFNLSIESKQVQEKDQSCGQDIGQRFVVSHRAGKRRHQQ